MPRTIAPSPINLGNMPIRYHDDDEPMSEYGSTLGSTRPFTSATIESREHQDVSKQQRTTDRSIGEHQSNTITKLSTE